jgi:hypothetical protein
MKTNTIKNTLKGIGFSLFMAAGLMVFSSTEAYAQYQDRDYRQDRRDDRANRQDDRNGRYTNQLYQTAHLNGFRDGLARGRADRRDRERENAQRSREYKRATNGYDRRLGNKNTYKQVYREAFLQGYKQAYTRIPNNSNYGY